MIKIPRNLKGGLDIFDPVHGGEAQEPDRLQNLVFSCVYCSIPSPPLPSLGLLGIKDCFCCLLQLMIYRSGNWRQTLRTPKIPLSQSKDDFELFPHVFPMNQAQ